METKPEELTHLHGNRLAEKDHPTIVFRGKLDSLCAMILEAQVLGESLGNGGFVEDLQEVLDFVRSIFQAEYAGTPMVGFSVLGLSSNDLRERSHHPERFFGRGHLLPMHRSMGALCSRLNLLRTAAREVEIAAVTAMRAPDRRDIVEALNRLSSLFYVLIYKYLPAGSD